MSMNTGDASIRGFVRGCSEAQQKAASGWKGARSAKEGQQGCVEEVVNRMEGALERQRHIHRDVRRFAQ